MEVKMTKLADLQKVFGLGWRKVWKALKADTGTKQRRPKNVFVEYGCSEVCAHDHSCCARWALDLYTLEMGPKIHVSCGEWALANQGQEKAIQDVPLGCAVLTAEWNDYYRTFSLTVSVGSANLPKWLEK